MIAFLLSSSPLNFCGSMLSFSLFRSFAGLLSAFSVLPFAHFYNLHHRLLLQFRTICTSSFYFFLFFFYFIFYFSTLFCGSFRLFLLCSLLFFLFFHCFSLQFLFPLFLFFFSFFLFCFVFFRSASFLRCFFTPKIYTFKRTKLSRFLPAAERPFSRVRVSHATEPCAALPFRFISNAVEGHMGWGDGLRRAQET